MRAPRSFSPVAAASQIATRSRSNHAYAFSDYASVSRSYTSNGLNQYATVGGNNYGYDSNGNLTADGTIAYTYDAENRLVVTSAGANLTYDPLGRLYRVTGALTDTRFLYDGDALVAEYDSAGNVTRRYMHSAGTDEPLTAYQGASVGDAARSYLYADHQGSIVAVANAWSNPMAINSYDDYGIPGWGNSGRFQYTGQAWIPELGMYHYKARVYSPTLGRFLQTDPIGYDDQVNLYAYVGNDPVNWRDPTGTCAGPLVIPCAIAGRCVINTACRTAAIATGRAAVRAAVAALRKQSDTITVYRFYGGLSPRNGKWWTVQPPHTFRSRADARDRLAINPRWGNTMESVVTGQVSAEDVEYFGTAAPKRTNNGILKGGAIEVELKPNTNVRGAHDIPNPLKDAPKDTGRCFDDPNCESSMRGRISMETTINVILCDFDINKAFSASLVETKIRRPRSMRVFKMDAKSLPDGRFVFSPRSLGREISQTPTEGQLLKFLDGDIQDLMSYQDVGYISVTLNDENPKMSLSD